MHDRGGLAPSAVAVSPIASARMIPATNQTPIRIPACTARASGSRGRSRLRNHTSTQCPASDGHSTSSIATGQRLISPSKDFAVTAPTTTAIAPVRISVTSSGSR